MDDPTETVVFPTTQGVRVYLTHGGDIAIDQEGSGGDDSQTVYIPIQHIDALCRALKTIKRGA